MISINDIEASKKPAHSLRLKLVLMTTSIILVMGVLTILFSKLLLENTLHEKQHEKAISIARRIVTIGANSILANNVIDLQKLLTAAKDQDKEIIYAYILNKDGSLLSHTFKSDIPAKLLKTEGPHKKESSSHSHYKYNNIPTIKMSYPILDGEAGNVHIGLSDQSTVDTINKVINWLITIILIVSCVGIGLSLFFSHLIIKPITSLIKATERVSAGDWDVQLDKTGNDEIGLLASTFKQMVDNLKTHSSERREIKTALSESESRLRAIFDNAAVGITLSDLQGNLLQANPAFQKMLGYNLEELQEKALSELTHPDDVAGHMDLYHEMLEGKRDHLHFRKRYLSKENKTVWGQTTLSVLRDEKNKPLMIVGMAENINVRKQLEDEQEKSNKLESIGVLAGGIAHDFNNLLTAILGNIILAQHMSKECPKVAEILKSAEKASLRAKGLTTQLLTFSRGGAPVKKEVSLTELIEETAKFQLSGSNVKGLFDFKEGIYPVNADEGQISQVIQNIIKNADQAMPNGGILKINVENIQINKKSSLPLNPGEYVKITIQDEGLGIPSTNLDKVFDPYFTTREKGNGLGLAIAYSIISNHNGLITLNSEEGKGTTFFIYMPAGIQKVFAPRSDAGIIVKDDPRDKLSGRILVMDDEEMVRAVVEALLTNLGMHVVSTADGKAAIEQYKSAFNAGVPYDAVLLDLTIPGGMGGAETMKQLQKFDPKAKVIVSSGYAQDPIMADYLQYGFKGVILKPYTLRELSNTIKNVLNSE